MKEIIVDIIAQSISIVGIVFLIMLLIEFINVFTHGLLNKFLILNNRSKRFIALLIGILPGCLGSYTSVALYSHQIFSFGDLLTTMIATTGDESMVMLAKFPIQYALLLVILVLISLLTGYLVTLFKVDKMLNINIVEKELPMHDDDDPGHEHHIQSWFSGFKNITKSDLVILSFISVVITVVLVFIFNLRFGLINNLMIISGIFLIVFAILTLLPRHFMIHHVWEHIIKIHLPKIFLWTLLSLLVVNLLLKYFNIGDYISANEYIVLIFAILVGIIPQSGPHLIFVGLFAQGSIPFSVLLANSIVQDGHGMLPMIGESRKTFFYIKTIKILIALIITTLLFLLGF